MFIAAAGAEGGGGFWICHGKFWLIITHQQLISSQVSLVSALY